MTLTLQLDSELERRLRDEASRSDESVDDTIRRVLKTVLMRKPFEVKPIPFGMEQRWPNKSASEILQEMEIAEYEEALDRHRHESASVRA